MPALTDAQLIDALAENGHEDVAEALKAKIEEDADTADEPTKAPSGGTLGGALRRAAGGG